MRRAVPGLVMSTMGQSSRAEPARATAYRYRGRPGWPFDPATRDDRGRAEPLRGGAVERTAERERKLAIFTAARAEEPPLSVADAGVRAGVRHKTAYRYENERKYRLSQQGDQA